MSHYWERDKQIYEFICGFLVDNGYAPTQAEIAEACGLHHQIYVYKSLRRLEEDELIWIKPGRIRNIRVVDPELNFVAIRSEHPDCETAMLEKILQDLYRLKMKRERQV